MDYNKKCQFEKKERERDKRKRERVKVRTVLSFELDKNTIMIAVDLKMPHSFILEII